MIVLFENGEPSLLLRDVKYDNEGNLKSGYVVNGAWNFEIRDGEVLAKAGNTIVTRRSVPDYDIMEVPKEIKGDYNSVMNQVRELYK